MNLLHRIILYKQPTYKPTDMIPINFLRNLCIRNLQTKRFLVLDIDTLPSYDLHSTLQAIPMEMRETDRNAFIVPLFFLEREKIVNHCKVYEDCFDL